MTADGGMSPHCFLQNPMEVKGHTGLLIAYLEASMGWKWVEMSGVLWSKGRDKSKGPQGIALQSPRSWGEKKEVLMSVKGNTFQRCLRGSDPKGPAP